MMRLVILAGLGAMLFKMLVGRWPWERKITAKQRALNHARGVLGVSKNASRAQIVTAHKELIAKVHPDKMQLSASQSQGAENDSDSDLAAAAYEANGARDLLLAELPKDLD